MTITVRFYGMLAVETGSAEMTLENIPDTVELQKILEQKYAEFKRLIYRIAVNQQIILVNQVLQDGDDIALIPPFPGG
jgi:molybdopterin converting factor small subunit